jgi:DNA primase
MDPVEEVKARLGIDEVVGGYVQLKQAGRNLKGICPFHAEKTPSFMVSTEKGIYHCFGCGEGGDIFSFVEKMDGLEFRETLQRLAGKANVELPQYQGGNQQQKEHKKRLYEALSTAAQYYHVQLGRSDKAKAYVTDERQMTPETIKDFQIGYAPGGNRRLIQFLGKHGFSQQEILDAGLARKRGQTLQDVFRRRIMVPFFDNSGSVIGFTGRLLDDGVPKYLNTPQTPLFDKSRFIFGLYQAKEHIRASGQAIVVEGNLDVVRSHQADIRNVVAISGTAITRQQLKQLARFANTVTLAFDADSAGATATERALPLAQEAGVALYIAGLPPDADPDDVIRRDPAEWQRIIDNKTYVMDWLLQILPAMYDGSSARGKKELTDHAASVLRRLEDPVEQEHYVNQLADLVGTAPATIAQKVASGTSKPRQPAPTDLEKESAPAADEVETVAEAVLSMAAVYPDVRGALAEATVARLPEQMQTAAAYLQSHEEELDPDNLPKELHQVENYVKILLLRGEEEYGSWATLDRQVEAFSLIHRLNELQTKRYKHHLSQQIAAAEAAGDYDSRKKLLTEFQQLN